MIRRPCLDSRSALRTAQRHAATVQSARHERTRARRLETRQSAIAANASLAETLDSAPGNLSIQSRCTQHHRRACVQGSRIRALTDAEAALFGRPAEGLRNVVELNAPSAGFIFAFETDAERTRFIDVFSECCCALEHERLICTRRGMRHSRASLSKTVDLSRFTGLLQIPLSAS
jgi:hypothetical protein